MKKKKFIFIGIIIVIILLVLISSNKDVEEENQININWESTRQKDVAIISEGWSQPKYLEVNNSGWEDSAHISPKGDEIYFMYGNVDHLTFVTKGKKVEIGPSRDPDFICGQEYPCGQFPRPDTFYAKKIDGVWQEAVPHPLTIKWPVIGMFPMEEKAYFHMEKNLGSKTDIYSSIKTGEAWGAITMVENINSDGADDDPWVSQDDNEMMFWSEREDKFKGKNIYQSRKVDGVWQKAELLPSPINSDGNDMQPFRHEDELYFSSDRGDGKLKIYSSIKNGEEWSDPKVVIRSNVAVGEPTLTEDGKYLYFVQIFESAEGYFSTDIMYIESIAVQ